MPPPAQYLIHKSLAASRRHVAASYWIAASDVAATSAPVSAAGQRRSTPPATGQRRWITMVIGGQRWRSTTFVGGKPPLTAAGPPLTTTGPPVNGGWWAGQSPAWAGSGSGLGRVWIGFGLGPGRLLELTPLKRSRKNTKCVNAANEELTVAKHKLMLLVYCC
nr:hypothetical protein [Tanacetum cinerariifolium]